MHDAPDEASARFWGEDALYRWSLFGAPLRPGPEDTALVARAIGRWAGAQAPRLLLLGSTPEVHAMAQAEGWPVLAVDRARAMLAAVWPGPPGSRCCADWTRLPLAPGSHDIAFLDGGLQMLGYPDGQAALARELARAVSPGGLFVTRVFVPPAVRESPDEVIAALSAGTLASPDELRLRLWMAVQESPAAGVALRRVWEVLSAAEPDLDALAIRQGWPGARVRVVDGYRHASERYYLTGVAEIGALFGEHGFALEDVLIPTYPRGACCPTVVLRRTGPDITAAPPR